MDVVHKSIGVYAKLILLHFKFAIAPIKEAIDFDNFACENLSFNELCCKFLSFGQLVGNFRQLMCRVFFPGFL